MTGVRPAVRRIERVTAVRVLARSGYAANGFLHGLIGVIVLVVAFGGRAETDQAGAFKAVAAAPWGFALLWLVAVGLWSLGLWHLLQAIAARRADPARRIGLIVSEAGQAAVFLAIGAIAAAVAVGAKPDAEEAAEGASRGILAIPGGALLLGATGVGVGVAGVVFVWMGVARSFRSKMTLPDGPAGRAISALGAVGFVAKGIALGIVGVLLTVAAVTLEPETAGGLDGAVQALIRLPSGSFLGGAVGVGFLAYGVFCLFRAVYARLDA